MDSDLNYEATELRLGLPDNSDDAGDGIAVANRNHYKRASPPDSVVDGGTKSSSDSNTPGQGAAPPASKALIVGWPPVRSYRRNNLPAARNPNSEAGKYVKVSMDGAPYLRKIDLRMYGGYRELIKALEDMFKLSIGEYSEREGYIGSEYAPAYEDKDGDLMLVGDVPWPMFIESCRRLRITKASSETGGGCRRNTTMLS